MNVTLLLVGLVVFAFVVGHVLNRYISRYVALSGAEYLLVGALIGPQLPPRLVTSDSLSQLVPLMSLLLGLIGFLVGLRARPSFGAARETMVGVFSTLGILLVVATGATSLAAMLVPSVEPPVLNQVLLSFRGVVLELYAAPDHLLLGAALGAAATVTSSGLLSSIGTALGARSETFKLLKTCATTSQLLAIITIGVVLALSRSEADFLLAGFGFGSWTWLAAAVALGLVCGGCFTLFIGKEEATSRIFLATVGTVTFASGVGSALGVSPLFVNLVSGLAVGAMSTHAKTLLSELDRLQHPIFVLLLVLTGALWIPASGTMWLFPLLYVALRWIFGRFFPYVFTKMWVPKVSPNRIGAGLMAQGTLAVAVAVDYALIVPEHAPIVLTTVLVGTLSFDMLAGGMVRRLLVDVEADNVNLTSVADIVASPKEAGL